MNEFSSQQYNQDEVNRIIRRALKIQNEDTISHEDLIETARAIGLDPQIVEDAIEQEQREFKKEKIRQAWLKRRKMGFYSHLSSYLIINTVLLLINNFTPGPWWFQWSVLGWGIGLAFHFKALFFPHGKRFEKGIRSEHHRDGFVTCRHRRFHQARTQRIHP
jgi:hypothetical protein